MPTHQPIFEQSGGFLECHASTLVQIGPDDFLAAWFAGTKEKNPDTGIWGSTCRNGKWSEPRLLQKINGEAHWNPVLHREETTGRVHLWFKAWPTIPGWKTFHTTSDDQGETWRTPEPFLEADYPLPRGPVKNKLIVLSDGTWVNGFSDEIKVAKPSDGVVTSRTTKSGEEWRLYTERSTDGGKTWEPWTQIAIDHSVIINGGAIQPTLWESRPGHVHLLARTTAGFMGRSDSTDAGRTWSPLRLTDMPNNNSGLDLSRLKDGTLALMCNPVQGNWAARSPLSLLLSHDNGETWTHRLDLETEKGEFSYPAIITTSDGGLAVTYTWNRRKISFWRGSAADVPQVSQAFQLQESVAR